MPLSTIDCTGSVIGVVQEVVDAGYHGFIRYVSPNTHNFPSKQVTAAEIQAIHAVDGAKIGFCYEYEPATDDYDKQIGYYTERQAGLDATRALAIVDHLAVPSGIPVFFGVDFDVHEDDLQGVVLAYFTSVHKQFTAEGRLVGVYGSGLTCKTLKEAGVVHFTWMAYAPKWQGNDTYGPSADIVQGLEKSVAGLNSDLNVVATDAVLW